MWGHEWWRPYKTTANVKLHIRQNFSHRRSHTKHQLLEGKSKGNLFGYVQCDIEVPRISKANFTKFPPLFKDTLVSKNDIGDLTKNYAEEEGIMSQPQKMLMSSSTLQNGTPITLLLLFSWQLGLGCTIIHRFLEHTPKKCLGSFVQSALDERRQSDENPRSSVVAETMELLANNSYHY